MKRLIRILIILVCLVGCSNSDVSSNEMTTESGLTATPHAEGTKDTVDPLDLINENSTLQTRQETVELERAGEDIGHIFYGLPESLKCREGKVKSGATIYTIYSKAGISFLYPITATADGARIGPIDEHDIGGEFVQVKDYPGYFCRIPEGSTYTDMYVNAKEIEFAN